MKLLKWFFISVLSLFLLAGGLLALLQSTWAKEQISHVIQEIAIQSGVKLKIDHIEGDIPLKWTLTHVQAGFIDGTTVDIDRLTIRLSLLPLLRGHLGISYLHADNTDIKYVRGTSPVMQNQFRGSFSIRSASFDTVRWVDAQTGTTKIFQVQGSGRLTRGGASFLLDGSLHSDAVDAKLFCEGSRRLDHVQTDLSLSVKDSKAFEPFYELPENISFDFEAQSEGSLSALKTLLSGEKPSEGRPIQGKLALVLHQPEELKLASQFSLSADRSWELMHLAILSPSIQLQGSGKFGSDGIPKTLYTTVALPNLSLFSPYLQGHATGEIDLHDEKCYLNLNIPEFSFNSTTFTQGKLEMLAQIQNQVWTAAVKMQADHPLLGYETTSELYWTPEQLFEIKALDFISKIGRISGDLKIFDPQHILGGLSFQVSDLRPLSELTTHDLAGQIGGEILFEGEEVSCRALGKQLKIDQLLSNRIDIDITHLNISNPTHGTLKIVSDEAYFKEIHFNQFAFDMGWNSQESNLWSYNLDSTGDWKGPFDLSSSGSLALSRDEIKLTSSKLEGHVLGKNIELQEKVKVEIGKNSFKIENLDLELGYGRLTLNTSRSEELATLKMHMEHFPLDFISLYTHRFSLYGLASLDADLMGGPDSLKGYLTGVLEYADIVPAGSAVPIQTKGSFQLHVGEKIFQLHSRFVATGNEHAEISLRLPIDFDLNQLKLTVPKDKPIAGEGTIEGHAQLLFDFINLGSQRVGGFMSCNLLLSGTLDTPQVQGPVEIQGGYYDNYFVGISIQNAEVKAQAKGNDIIIKKATATDGEKGTSLSTGIIHLSPRLPFTLEGTIENFRVIRFDWLTASCTGPFGISGDLTGSTARGNLAITEANVTIPEALPYDIPTLPITFINEPKAHQKLFNLAKPYPFRYDLNIHGDKDIHLSGRGIDAQLEGDIHLTGQNLAVLATGALYTKKGKFSFAGKDFIINKGEIVFSDEKSFMNITSTADYPGLTVTVHFRGDLRSPQLLFESNPSMPTSSILAQILFNKDVSELTAAQAVQLASTIVTLSGTSGPNVLDTIRKNIGVDRLTLSSNDETGQISVEIGKYITKGVLISLIQGTENSQVRVQVELKAGFVLEGETQQDSQGKFSFKWNKNY